MTAFYIGLVVWLQLDGTPKAVVTFDVSTTIEACYKDIADQSALPENKEPIQKLFAAGLTPVPTCVKMARPVKL